MRHALLAALTLLLATPALAHGPTAISSWNTLYSPPTAGEVEVAIDDAAAEWSVPAELLHVIAYVESRYSHHPSRVSADGRAGLFQITPERLAFAADFLSLDEAVLLDDVTEHARAMAFLLAAVAPPQPTT